MALKPAPQLVHVARANAVVQASDDAIAAVRQQLAALQESAQPLRDQVAALEAEGAAPVGPDTAVVDALVADPASTPDMAAITAAVSAARKQADVRSMTIATLQAAIDRIEGEAAKLEAEIASLTRRRTDEWQLFGSLAREYLMAKFEADFVALRDTVLLQAEAFSRLSGLDGKPLQSWSAARLGPRTEVAISWYDADTRQNHQNILFPLDRSKHPIDEVLISRFRAGLSDTEALPSK